MRTATHTTGQPPDPGSEAAQAPVFVDLSGRRSRRMKLAGLGAGAGLLACLSVMTISLLGGPRAAFLPWSVLNTGKPVPAVSEAGITPTSMPNPAILPPPSSGPPQVTPSASSPAATSSGSGSPAPVTTNRASKTPPGRNRSDSPHPSPSPSRHASTS